MVFAAVIHPIGSITGWTSGRHSHFGVGRGTLDGMAYIEEKYPGDYAGINWINDNIGGSPVMLEAPGATYRYSARVATMTGLPTVVGWLTHEVMWRNSWDVVSWRDTDTDAIYQTLDEEEALSLLRKYNVEYIFIGSVERERYEAAGLMKFARQPENYELLFQEPGVEIYRVLR
jgi:uncharacterized membrane protein